MSKREAINADTQPPCQQPMQIKLIGSSPEKLIRREIRYESQI